MNELNLIRKKAAELFKQEKYPEIIELLTDEVLENYNDAELYAIRSELHTQIKDDIGIRLHYAQKAIEANPEYFAGYYAKGRACFVEGDYDGAMQAYTKTIELNPYFTVVYTNRGNVWFKKRMLDEAMSDYNQAIRMSPNDADAYLNRGNVWLEKGMLDEAMSDYNYAIELNSKFSEAYYNRGCLRYLRGEYDAAIIDYNRAIELNPLYADAYNNRGVIWHTKEEYDRAIADYTQAIKIKPEYYIAYSNRGNDWLHKKEFGKALADYNKALEIKSDYPNAYFNRADLRRTTKEFETSIRDYKKYLELSNGKDEVRDKRARGLIEELQEKIKDKELRAIGDLTSKIKRLLLISDGCVTHYTGLSTIKKLIFDGENKFRISEGSFLNDTSEGTELFNFLGYEFSTTRDGLIAETFAPKPFIGSFVAEGKHDDLNLWRFYGKEGNVEARGGAVTIRIRDFVDAINKSLEKGSENPVSKSEEDINFYRVAYWDHDKDKINFQIPNAGRGAERKLNTLMKELKEKVGMYRAEDKSLLEKYLNTIAFLFKSEAYKNENELRLIIRGIEFEKQYNLDITSPRVYIELVNIHTLIEQITLGPKVDKPDEWAAAIYYSYSKYKDEKIRPKILISRLPYK